MKTDGKAPTVRESFTHSTLTFNPNDNDPYKNSLILKTLNDKKKKKKVFHKKHSKEKGTWRMTRRLNMNLTPRTQCRAVTSAQTPSTSVLRQMVDPQRLKYGIRSRLGLTLMALAETVPGKTKYQHNNRVFSTLVKKSFSKTFPKFFPDNSAQHR